MESGNTYIDITGLYHLNKPGVTGVYRVEDQISRYVSKFSLKNTFICTWTSIAKGYYPVKYNKKLNNGNKRFYDKKDSLAVKVYSILIKIALISISNNIFNKLITNFLFVIKADILSNKFLKIKNNWRNYYNIKIDSLNPNIIFTENDILIVPTSAYISNVNYANNLINTHNKTKCKILIFVYDMLPYFDLACSQKYKAFSVTMEAAARLKWQIITISKYSKSEIMRYLDINNYSSQNILVQPLPITFPNYLLKPKSVNKNIKNKYVLYVSTLGERKNHIFLLKLWLNLFLKNGDNTPNLLFVGKDAEATDIIKHKLGELPETLRNKIYLIGSITDRELYFYYKFSWITVFPSLFEGWGLPVSESQYFNKVCICNTGSSLDEASGGYSVSISVSEIETWETELNSYISDNNIVTSKENTLKQHIVKSDWNSYCENIFKLIKTATN